MRLCHVRGMGARAVLAARLVTRAAGAYNRRPYWQQLPRSFECSRAMSDWKPTTPNWPRPSLLKPAARRITSS
ncbi:hypothetical protein XFF6166_500013 [Xanthomonas citri pv. fuscans]|uniref:Uncharacterized protein n=1 Tax=Xanthomonas campestris pv. phaseoli TaxID=317013 RepID=A0A7Z7J4Z3_XANCH|nr:hypothetical protein XFF6166_500013 [Xanthomonas citri pv. fuscans]SOO26141.1 hypothetical protein XFF6991_520115 [Xanthomonas phaseoli pv. phaseoli]SON96065.1 hypothetical protein XFF6990_290216 [Xanthomonas citri pv. fuscans]SOO00357.1 hypothetical protein XFF7767_1080025 [Xanthomonas citri pv. fuscans]SOO01370.1 hypothetical protein XFF6960_470013 [Xanthomonas citri pv. fuscans]